MASGLLPADVLRVGVVVAETAGVFFVAVGADGAPRGVTVDLGAAMAARLGVPVAYTVYAASGDCTEAVSAGQVDVGFMPVDAARREKVAFGPAYYLLESTYAVTAESGIRDLAGVDRAGVRVVGVTDTTTIRAAGRSLKNVAPIAIDGVKAAVAAFVAGEADALALSRDSLAQVVPHRAGSFIVEGGFQQTTISIAVPKGRDALLAEASAFLEDAKRDGTVRRALDGVGLSSEKVAP